MGAFGVKRVVAGLLEEGENRAGMAGRNDPCPCGSGKKYKKCCLPRAEELEARARHHDQVRERWSELVFAIHEELRERYPREALMAWSESFGYQPLEEEEMPFLLDFLAFCHPLEGGKTPAEMYFGDGSRFESAEDEMIWMTRPYSLYKVTEQTGPDEFVLRDLLLRKDTPYLVRSGRVDEGLTVGGTLFGKLVSDGDAWVPVSVHPRCLLGRGGDWVAEEFLGHRKSCHSSTLEKPKNAKKIYLTWMEAVEGGLSREGPPEMVNFDGEPIALSRDVWSFDPKRRRWLVEGLSRVDGLKEVGEDSFVYGTEERPVMGFVTLKENELWVDSNSFERVDRISGVVCEQCGDLLTFVREVDQAEIMASMPPRKGPSIDEPIEKMGGRTMRELLEDPDIRAQLEAQLPEGVSFDHLLT